MSPKPTTTESGTHFEAYSKIMRLLDEVLDEVESLDLHQVTRVPLHDIEQYGSFLRQRTSELAQRMQAKH